MRNCKKHAWGIGILFGLILLLTGTAGADYVDSVVLIPDADGAFNNWTDESGCTDHYDCVNDSNAASCAGSMDSYIKTTTGVEQYRHTTAPDTSNNLDSMAMYVEFEEEVSGTGGAWTVAFGWRFKIEDWYYCEYEGGLDTVSVNGTECVVYRKSWTQDPCWSASRGLGWIYFGWTYDGEADPNNNIYQPCMYPATIETGCIPNCYMRCYNVWLVLYFTVTEAEGNPRRNREQRQRGGIQDEKMGLYARFDSAVCRQ